MAETPCKFVWYDLMTPDSAAAASFYQKVIGWQAQDAHIPDRSYTLLTMGPDMVAGLLQAPATQTALDAQPGWLGHIGVSDVDAYVVRVVEAGGGIHRAAEDIPGVGRFAVVADLHGVPFILFRPNGQPPTLDRPDVTQEPGHIGWHELHAGDGDAAWTFYSGLFGWTKAEAIDMGPYGVYQTFASGNVPVGGMMTKMPEMPAPAWIYYFSVDGVVGAIDRVKNAGGKLLVGPIEVPGGSWIAQFLDPQGVMFAVVGPKG